MSLLCAQGLFESSVSGSRNYTLQGNIRSGLLIAGRNDSLYAGDMHARAGVTLKAEASRFAYGRVDMTLEYRYAGEHDTLDADIRELYVDLNVGPLHARLGKQIEIWGRTDAFHPLDNITPRDMRRIYAGTEDMRLGNYLVNGSVNTGGVLRFQGIWIPVYRADIISLSMFELPANVVFGGVNAPEAGLKNSAYALRAEITTAEYDAGFSYCRSYGLQPGFSAEMQVLPEAGIRYRLTRIPWRQRVYGFDAAFTAGRWSLRFESALTDPDSAGSYAYVPERAFEWCLGADRAFGPLRLLLEYHGKYVPALKELLPPADPSRLMDHYIARYNRLLYRQEEKVRHEIFFRGTLPLFHETLELEFSFLYHFSAKEYMFAPAVKIDPADGLGIRLGYSVYAGDDESLFDMLGRIYNGGFAVVEIAF